MQDADPVADAACQCKVLAANFLTFPSITPLHKIKVSVQS